MKIVILFIARLAGATLRSLKLWAVLRSIWTFIELAMNPIWKSLAYISYTLRIP